MNSIKDFTKAYYCYYQMADRRVCVVDGEKDPYRFIRVHNQAQANAVIAGLEQQGYTHKVSALS